MGIPSLLILFCCEKKETFVSANFITLCQNNKYNQYLLNKTRKSAKLRRILTDSVFDDFLVLIVWIVLL